jgi:hypothetical protein
MDRIVEYLYSNVEYGERLIWRGIWMTRNYKNYEYAIHYPQLLDFLNKYGIRSGDE